MAKPSLLIADADPRSLRILELALRKAGFAVATAPDGTQALQRLLAAPPDLLICEASLPSKDGLAVCAEARAAQAALPIIVTSGDPTLAARALEAGADEFLRKPILLKELVRRAQALLESRALLRGAPTDSIRGSLPDLGPVEAPRRAEELASGELSMTSRFSVDYPRLADLLADLPDEVNGVIQCFDGHRTLREAIDLSPVDDLGTLLVVRRLLSEGILRVLESTTTALKPSLQEWLFDPPPPQEGTSPLSLDEARMEAAVVEEMSPAEASALQQEEEADADAEEAARRARRALVQEVPVVRFPPLRGVRRERLRREAEEARARIGEGKAVRLSRVVELPVWRSDGSDALLGARQMSPAVGEAARKFAPEAPVARLMNGPTEPPAPVTTPPIAPVAQVTPPIAAVAPVTPPIAAVALETPPPERGPAAAMQKALPARRRWVWMAAVLAALLVVAFLLRKQPGTDKKDAPWLEPVAGEQGARPPHEPAHAPPPRTAEPAAPPPKAAEPPPKAAELPPKETEPPPVAGSASDRLYSKALEMGEERLRGGRYKLAIAHFRRAVKERPQAVPALLALGDAYLEADQPRSAVQPLQKAARLDPKSGRAQLLLGTAWQSLGKNAQAREAYLRYLELEPEGEFSRDVRVILANLAHGG